MFPKTEFCPELPFVFSAIAPAPPAPIVIVYVVPKATTSCDSADEFPPENSPATEER
jgi:hypothetical protein